MSDRDIAEAARAVARAQEADLRAWEKYLILRTPEAYAAWDAANKHDAEARKALVAALEADRVVGTDGINSKGIR